MRAHIAINEAVLLSKNKHIKIICWNVNRTAFRRLAMKIDGHS